MPFICLSCNAKITDDVGAFVVRAGTCTTCTERLAREHAELAGVVPFYDPACAIVLRMEVLLHG